MNLSHTEQLFLEAIRAALCGETVPWEQVEPEEWNALINLSAAHKLHPMIVDAVHDSPAAVRWEPFALQKKSAKAQVMAQAIRTTEFFSVYEKLLAAGYRPLVVKGILCRSVYPNGDLRQSSDEDLYVTEKEFSGCCAALKSCGMYSISSEDDTDVFEIGWRKQNSPIYIELHKSLFSRNSTAVNMLQSYFTDSFACAHEYQTEVGTVWSLSPHDHLLYLILHAYKHFILSGFGIRQICDIGLWAKTYFDKINWTDLYRQCNEAHALKFASAIFTTAEKYLSIDIQLPDGWNEMHTDCGPLLKDALCAGIYGSANKSRAHSASVTLNAVSAERKRKHSSVLQSVFPSKDKLKGDYPILKKCAAALPFVWCIRLWKYKKETGDDRQNRARDSLKIAKERMKLLMYYDIIEK